MKLTIFGLTLSSSWGNGHATPYRALLRGLRRLGHQVTFYEKDVPYYGLHRDLPQPDFCNLFLYESWQHIRAEALQEARASDAVMVGSFCPKGQQVIDDLLELSGPLRVFYDLDTPVTLSMLGAGGVEYIRREQIPEFELYLSWTGGAALTRLENEFNARLARPLYGCVDPQAHARVPAGPQFQCDLSYMGTHAADRQAKLEELFLEPARRAPERSFLLAGSLYPWEWPWPANVRRMEHVAPEQHPALYSSSRATLNITRADMAQNGYCPSGRFFEAAACGTPILTDYWEGLDQFFHLGDELFVVSSAQDVLDALAGSDQHLAQVAERARQRTFDEHTGEHRARELLHHLEEAGRSRPADTALSQESMPQEVES